MAHGLRPLERRPTAVTVGFPALAFAFGFVSGILILWLIGLISWGGESVIVTGIVMAIILLLALRTIGATVSLGASQFWPIAGALAGAGALIAWLPYAFRDFGE